MYMFRHTNVTEHMKMSVYIHVEIHVVQNTPVSGRTLHENMHVNMSGMLEVGMLEVGTLKVGTLEVSMLEVGMPSIHTICSLAISVG